MNNPGQPLNLTLLKFSSRALFVQVGQKAVAYKKSETVKRGNLKRSCGKVLFCSIPSVWFALHVKIVH